MAESDHSSLSGYDEELFMKQRQAARVKERLSIKNELVTIAGSAYTFSRREFPAGFSMVTPETFTEMPPAIAKQIFPYEDRPETIVADRDYRICIAFSSGELSGDSPEDRLLIARGYIKRICPTAVFFSNGIYHLPNGLAVAHYDYRYPAVDDDLYDLTFFTDLPDQELLGWFICPLELKEHWEPLTREMIQTIAVTPKE